VQHITFTMPALLSVLPLLPGQVGAAAGVVVVTTRCTCPAPVKGWPCRRTGWQASVSCRQVTKSRGAQTCARAAETQAAPASAMESLLQACNAANGHDSLMLESSY